MEITLKADRCRYTYNHDNGMCESMPLIVKPYTLEELYQVYDDMKAKHKLAKCKYNTAEEELTQYVRAHSLSDIKVDATEFKALKERSEWTKQDCDVYALALDGIRGAIRYYQAMRLNEAYAEVLPKYAGKQAGPKTRGKFQKEIAGFFPNKVSIYHNYMYSVSLSDEKLGIDNSFYANEDLTTRGNQFNPDYCILLPSDSFSGHYPENWLVWATHVQSANAHIKELFDSVYNEIQSINRSLSIGYTKMLTVSHTSLQER